MIKYNLSDFAQAIGISRRTLYRWIEKGLIEEPKKTEGGKNYFTHEDVLKYDALVKEEKLGE